MSALARLVRFTAPPDAKSADLARSELSHGMTISGTLDCEGVLHVHGRVFGRINTDRVVIEPDGFVEGDIVAREATIGGRLLGRVFAHTVSVDETADINGRIFHHVVTVAKGAKFEGRMPWRPLNFFETLDQLPEVQA
ncbi:MAG TPA: polymer-forming cytoskeletal protein [Rhizomicrobium sp.]|jgi:cytoskeletal protein CcmA (bactofilin family)|nr:polymer-forming cytoskeletal protein [Rhizomicrobium sp.]